MYTTQKQAMTTKFSGFSISEMQDKYRYGSVSDADMQEYLRAWNAGPHFTQAVFADGAIRNFDPESGSYKHLWEKFGVRP